MSYASRMSFEEFQNSAVANCFIGCKGDNSFRVKVHIGIPERTQYFIGSVGDAHGEPELFRLAFPVPLAVGDKGTILNLSRTAIQLPYPTFAAQNVNADGYFVISSYFGAQTTRVGRLIAIYWLSCPKDATEVHHIDGNPAHDELSNLEWVSHGENIKQGRHSKHQHWDENDILLMIRQGMDPVVIHPSKITAFTGSRNGCHVLRRGTRKSINGWYPCQNPSLPDLLDFIDGLPFDDTEKAAQKSDAASLLSVFGSL